MLNRKKHSANMSRFSPFASPFQSRLTGEALKSLSILEDREASTVPSAADLDFNDHRFDNFQLYNSQYQQHNLAGNWNNVAAQANIWGEDASIHGAERSNIEIIDYINIFAYAYFKSILSQDQLKVLLTLSPSELCEKLLEVAKNRIAPRTRGRRFFYSECAFCKNNGENEEHYSSHALKDWRGRVLCPVLRAFNCPRCGATGDRAHTIKYCPYNIEQASERAGNMLQRQSASHGSLLGGGAAALHQFSRWSNFGTN